MSDDTSTNRTKIKKRILISVAIVAAIFIVFVATCRIGNFGIACSDNGMCKRTVACNNTPTNPCAVHGAQYTLGSMCNSFAEGNLCDPGIFFPCHCKTVKSGAATLRCSCQ